MPTVQVSPWQCAATTLNSAPDPEAALVQLGAADWRPVAVPGAVAGSVEGDIDAWNTDWWFRTTLVLERATSARSLRFDGVATLATVWVNGIKLAENNDMFAGFDAELPMEAGTYEVVVVCRGLASIEPPTKPRQRWRTQLVSDPRLRWIRTSLWGHMPGWTPPVPAVGIVRSVTLRCEDAATTLRDGVHHHSDGDGLHWRIDARFAADQTVTAATLTIGDTTSALEIAADGAQLRVSGSGAVSDLERT